MIRIMIVIVIIILKTRGKMKLLQRPLYMFCPLDSRLTEVCIICIISEIYYRADPRELSTECQTANLRSPLSLEDGGREGGTYTQ